MSGAAWAAVSGLLFGVFQAVSAVAVRRAANVTLTTFVQLLVATVVVGAVAAVVEGVDPLADLPLDSLALFALAGLIHFFVGWGALNRSQHRIGAARTAPLLATSPLFGLLLGLVAYQDVPGAVALGGIAVTVAGAYVLTDPGSGRRAGLADSGWGLVTAFAWGVSAAATVEGLAGFGYPLLGVTIGMAASTLPFGVLLAGGRVPVSWADARDAIGLKLLAGTLVAVATWWRWLALDDEEIGVVLALQLMSVPAVLVAAPLVARRLEHRDVEVVTPRLLVGSGVVVAGALALILG